MEIKGLYRHVQNEFRDAISPKKDIFLKAAFSLHVHTNKFMVLTVYDPKRDQCLPELTGVFFEVPHDSMRIRPEDEGKILYKKIDLVQYLPKYYFLFEDIVKEAYKTDKLDIYYSFFIGDVSKKIYGIITFVTKKQLSQSEIELLYNITCKFDKLIKEYYYRIITNLYLNKFIKSILYMMNGYDTYTYYHSLRVADFSSLIGEELRFDEEKLYFSGLIHDLGKLWIPRGILYKKGRLTPEEFNIVKYHPQRLEEIFWGNFAVQDYVEIAKYHHEKLDGSGYMKKKGNEIPDESKVLIVSDIIDAMLNDRPYRSALPLEVVIKELNSMVKKGKLDGKVVEKAIPLISDYYIGSMGVLKKLGFSISKSITIHYIKKAENYVISGVIESVSGNVLNVLIVKKSELSEEQELPEGYKVSIEYMLGGDLKRVKGVIISKFHDGYTIKVTGTTEKKRALRIFWRLDIEVAPTSYIGDNLSFLDLLKRFKNFHIKAYTKVVGGDFLSFVVSKEEDIFHLGDSVIVKMAPLKEELFIPGIITHKVEEFEDHVEYWMEYIKLSEKISSKLYQAIFRRQIEIKLGLKEWTQ